MLAYSNTIEPGEIQTWTMDIPQTLVEFPYPPEVQAGPDLSANVGEPVTFAGSFNDVNPGDTHQIAWDFGDGNTAGNTLIPNHIYTTVGVYTVTLTVTDSIGFELADTLQVTVN